MLFHDHHQPHRRTSLGTIHTFLHLDKPLCHRYQQNDTVSGRVSLEYCASDHLPEPRGRHLCGDSDELIAAVKIGVQFVGRATAVVPAHQGVKKERVEEVLFERVQWLHEGGTRLRCWEETDFEFSFAFPGVTDECKERGWEFGIDGLRRVGRDGEVLPASFCQEFGGRGGGMESAKVEYVLRPIVEIDDGVEVEVKVCEGVEMLYWPVKQERVDEREARERQVIRRSGEVKVRRREHLQDVAAQQVAQRHGLGAKMMAVAHLHHHNSMVVPVDIVFNLPMHILYDQPIAVQIDVRPSDSAFSASLEDLETKDLELSIIESCSACVNNDPRLEHHISHPLDSSFGLDGYFEVFDSYYRRCIETSAMKLELPPAFSFRHDTLLRTYRLRVSGAIVVGGQKVMVDEEVPVEIVGTGVLQQNQSPMVLGEGADFQVAGMDDVAPPRYEDVFRGTEGIVV